MNLQRRVKNGTWLHLELNHVKTCEHPRHVNWCEPLYGQGVRWQVLEPADKKAASQGSLFVWQETKATDVRGNTNTVICAWFPPGALGMRLVVSFNS